MEKSYLDYIREQILPTAGNVLAGSNPVGWTYGLIDLFKDGSLPGVFPSADERRPLGTKTIIPDGDIKYWAGPGYGYQSGGSYKQVTGNYPSGYKPAPTAPQTTSGQQAGTPPAAPTGSLDTGKVPEPPKLPGDKPKDTIEQGQDSEVKRLFGVLESKLTPEFIDQVTRIQNRAAIERSLVTSLLAKQQTEAKTEREREIKTIEAWQAIQQEKIRANSAQAAALASAAWASTQLAPSAVQEAYKAALTPFQNFRLT